MVVPEADKLNSSGLTFQRIKTERFVSSNSRCVRSWLRCLTTVDTQNYLGHSINAPTGRWQKNKDVHWYNRDKQQTAEEREEEMKKIKEAEAEALAAALYAFVSAPLLFLYRVDTILHLLQGIWHFKTWVTRDLFNRCIWVELDSGPRAR